MCLAGEIAIVGPALSALDAQLAFQDPRTTVNPKEAKRNAAHYAAAQEARSMLGQLFPPFSILGSLTDGKGDMPLP